MEQTQSGLLVPNGTMAIKEIPQDPEIALKRYYGGMAKMERTFPALVKMAIMTANFIEAMARQRGIKPEGVVLDVARWHKSGMVTIGVEFDPEAKRDTNNDQAVKNFDTLQAVNEDYPQAVELAMALAYQLVGVVNNKKLMPATIKTSTPKWSASGNILIFKITAGGLPLTPPMDVRI